MSSEIVVWFNKGTIGKWSVLDSTVESAYRGEDESRDGENAYNVDLVIQWLGSLPILAIFRIW
jgi:hypothetical protein